MSSKPSRPELEAAEVKVKVRGHEVEDGVRSVEARHRVL